MLTTAELLKLAKDSQDIPSNYRLARVLDVPDTTVMRWNTGRSRPDDETVIRLANMANIDSGYAIASIHAERCSDESMRNVWKSIADRLQIISTVTATSLILISVSPNDAQSKEVKCDVISQSKILCQMALFACARFLLNLLAPRFNMRAC